ncbi:MAG: adenine deaminase [Deltaproteobacteria bacterium]|nr:adenine deaminase [Deltaproteobacteria bacterium]
MSPNFQRRIDAALGKIECDLVIHNVRFLDVFTCEWKEGDVSIVDGAIVGLESGLKARRTIEGRHKHLVPGFIDAHVHVESSLLVPHHFERAVLPRGTTTAICDPHELTNVMGVDGLRYFLSSAEKLSLDLRVMLSSCVPATTMETNGGGTVDADQLVPLLTHPNALGLAEMMNVPGVLNADPAILKKLEAFAGRPIDGHCPKVSGRELSAYASAGISTCHESSTLPEALEKLTKGISCWIREGSVAKDLDALIPILTLATSTSVGFCTDDRNPLDIATEGHIDHLVRTAIKRGVAPEVAYRAASWSVARHYGLRQVGAIAPGYRADLVLLDDARTCAIREVFKAGTPAGEIRASGVVAAPSKNSVRASLPAARDLKAPAGRVHVIGVEHGSILTDHLILDSAAPGVARLSVLERHGHGSKPANGYVDGFGAGMRGAIASSVGHDSHNLIAVGSNEADMSAAMGALIESGGGFCVVQDGAVKARLALPLGGLMSTEDAPSIARSLRELHAASKAIGCELPEPFLQLAFLSLPVIPSLKLTDKGLVDVEKFSIIDVRAS